MKLKYILSYNTFCCLSRKSQRDKLLQFYPMDRCHCFLGGSAVGGGTTSPWQRLLAQRYTYISLTTLLLVALIAVAVLHDLWVVL